MLFTALLFGQSPGHRQVVDLQLHKRNCLQVITAMLMQVKLCMDVRPWRLTKSYRLFRHESSGIETTELNDFVLLESERAWER